MKVKLFNLLVLIVVVELLMGGCSKPFDETSYQYPNWTPEGLIYCQKSITHYLKQPFGTLTQGTDYSYVTMDTDGKNEVALSYNSYPYYSPKGIYTALISGETISIYKRADNSKIYSFVPTTENISSLDWGPDEDSLVFRTSKGAIYISNINGGNIALIKNNGYSIAWRYRDKIIIDSIPGVVSVNSSNFSNIIGYPNVSGGEFNISPTTNEAIYRSAYNEGIKKFNLASSEAIPTILINRNDLWNIHVSPDGQEIIASGNNIVGEQIWLINIDGTGLKQLK